MINKYMNIYLDIEEVKKIVASSICIRQAIKTLGIARGTFKKYIAKHNIPIEHFNPFHYRHGITKEMRICKCCNKEFECLPCEEKQYCSISCSNRSRIRTKNTKEKISKTLKEYNKKQKELGRIYPTKKTFIQKVCPICNKVFSHSPCYKNKVYCSKECYNNDTECKFRKKSPGGYRKGSGWGKSGWYHGTYCDSSWELAWVIYNEEHNIKFERCKNSYPYIFQGLEHKYFPDFILEDGTLIEIKGRRSNEDCDEQTKVKLNCIKGLTVLYRNDIEPLLKYVTDKYGTDFIKLYEGNPYTKRNNSCEICGAPSIKRFCSRSCAGKNLKIFKEA